MKKKILFPVFLAALAVPLCLSTKAQGTNAQFIGEYNDKNSYLQYGIKINSQLADEGFVLLKNDGSLPLEEGARISVVGKSSTSLALGGGGSGSGSSNVSEIQLKQSLTDVGFEINPTTDAFYRSSKSGSGRTNGNGGWKGNSDVTIGETPITSVENEAGLIDSLDEYNDAAIMVVAREGSEGCDVKTCNASDDTKTNSGDKIISERHALELSKNEQDLFDLLHEHFDHIIMIINSANIFECGQFQDDDQVAGVLWVGCVGDVGAGAIGRILVGDVNPSGRTVDTWARDFTKDPTFQNFSDNAQTNRTTNANGVEIYAAQDTMFNADGTPTFSFGTDQDYNNHNRPRWADEKNKVVSGGINGVKPSAYVSYEEGIYVDYRYYETKYDDMAETNKNSADNWYNGDEGVVYPFGYGLSYTTFEQKIVSSNIKNKILKSGNYEVSVTVNVKNTGSVPGKDVVQLYWRAPYYDGGIEKASKVLCAFDKTDILEPGDDQNITLKFYTQDVANYDCFDANNNGFSGYELDAGKYEIVLGKDAHDVYEAISFKVADGGIKYETDRFTGHKVENRFTDRGFYNSMPGEDDIEFEQMSREDLDGTFPHHPTIESRTLGANSRVEEFLTHEFSIAEVDVEKNFECIPEAAYKTKEDIEALGWTQGNGKTDVKFTDMLNTDIDDPKWVDFMNQLTYDEMLEYVYGPGEHNKAISRLNKPGTGDSDGPQQFKSARAIYWVCSPIIAATYNVDLAKKQGECIGMESHFAGSTVGWAGPAVNLHRSPFGGRNFEYYCADPYLMGKIAGRVVAGATDRGMYCFFKHFAVNDQEKNRESGISFLTEQALRELYLKPFQMCVQEGKSIGLMSSYNRLGLMETAASYPLLYEVLREEWGFKGSIISDMTHSGNSSVNNACYECINNRVLAACDQELDNGGGFKEDIECEWSPAKCCPTFKYKGQTYESYTWWYAVRMNAQRVIWMCARSSVNSQTMLMNVENAKLSNVNRGVFEGEVGKDVNIEIELPDELAGADMEIDPFTALPEGLEFDGSKITGSSDVPVNKFIHVLVDSGEGSLRGLSFELRIYATGNNGVVEDDPDAPKDGGKKKGCFGSFEITMLSVAALGTAMIAFLLIDKKRRITK